MAATLEETAKYKKALRTEGRVEYDRSDTVLSHRLVKWLVDADVLFTFEPLSKGLGKGKVSIRTSDKHKL